MNQEVEIIKQLKDIWDSSTYAYRAYLEDGKTFALAKNIKKENLAALWLLQKNLVLFSATTKPNVLLLIDHYLAWSSKWDQLAAEKSFQKNELFVFENSVTFPKEAAKQLLTLIEK